MSPTPVLPAPTGRPTLGWVIRTIESVLAEYGPVALPVVEQWLATLKLSPLALALIDAEEPLGRVARALTS